MANINIDTTDVQYQKLLNGLGTLRVVLAPRIKLLMQLPEDKQKQWLRRDPLLRRAILFARNLSDLVDLELDE